MALSSAPRLLKGVSIIAQTSRAVATTSVNKAGGSGSRMNDPLEHATGPEKFELLAMQKGNDDPFFMKASTRGKGTKAEPNIVDAMDSFRMVGCVCNEHDTHVKWMWVFEGKPKRCFCGHWFNLKRHPAPEMYTKSMPL